MYDELVKQCRDCIDCLCGECKYEHLQKPGNFVPCMNALLGEAADAIEELQQYAELYKDSGEAVKKAAETYKAAYIAEHDARVAELPRWIPVTERLPDEIEDVLIYGEWIGASGTTYREIWLTDMKSFLHQGYKPIAWMPLPEPPKEV